MERILTGEMLAYNAANPTRNLVMPISPTAKETYSLFLLLEGTHDAQTNVLLLERVHIFVLIERP